MPLPTPAQDILSLPDQKLIRLIDAKWQSSEEVFKTVEDVYKRNSLHYNDDGGDKSRMPLHILKVGAKSHRVRANRIFRDAESVINALIANPPRPNVNVSPGRPDEQYENVARLREKFLLRKYADLDMKGKLRRGLRFLYKSRLIVMHPFWNPQTNDIDVEVVDPRKVRVYKRATCELESDFFIWERDTTVAKLCEKYPQRTRDILKSLGMSEEQLLLEDRDTTYREAWIGDFLIVKFQSLILDKRRNPYWDWDGILLNGDEAQGMATDRKSALASAQADGQQEARRTLMEAKASAVQGGADLEGASSDDTASEGVDLNAVTLESYFFNHFDRPRKPFVFATVLNDEQKPIGSTDFIGQAIPLQEALDRRKRQIDDNAQFVNGVTKVDSSVMGREQANELRYDTGGVIHGKNVVAGVQRETGTPLPQFVFDDMQDSRNEIDNIMGATSAFRGEREGQETKAGRLALIDQSYLNLNELVQVVDYVSAELFNWFYQLMKLNYTERHYAKVAGADAATAIVELTRDDIADGEEVTVIPGKSLPEDRAFRYERAQTDKDVLAVDDYLREAGYDDPKTLASKSPKTVIQQAEVQKAVAEANAPPPGAERQPNPNKSR